MKKGNDRCCGGRFHTCLGCLPNRDVSLSGLCSVQSAGWGYPCLTRGVCGIVLHAVSSISNAFEVEPTHAKPGRRWKGVKVLEL